MGKLLLYGALVLLLLLGSWFYRQEEAPDSIIPFMVFLLGLMSLGYGLKAREDGDIGAGSGKIRSDRNPGVFRLGLYLNHFLTALLFLIALYLLFS